MSNNEKVVKLSVKKVITKLKAKIIGKQNEEIDKKLKKNAIKIICMDK